VRIATDAGAIFVHRNTPNIIIFILDLPTASGSALIVSDYSGGNIEISHKKPRKNKKNPVTSLSDEQKAENRGPE
jgi:hypothetical protein